MSETDVPLNRGKVYNAAPGNLSNYGARIRQMPMNPWTKGASRPLQPTDMNQYQFEQRGTGPEKNNPVGDLLLREMIKMQEQKGGSSSTDEWTKRMEWIKKLMAMHQEQMWQRSMQKQI